MKRYSDFAHTLGTPAIGVGHHFDVHAPKL
jgi:hypothetical protein